MKVIEASKQHSFNYQDAIKRGLYLIRDTDKDNINKEQLLSYINNNKHLAYFRIIEE